MSGFAIDSTSKNIIHIGVKPTVYGPTTIYASFYIDRDLLGAVGVRLYPTKLEYSYLYCDCNKLHHFTFAKHEMNHAVKVVISGMLL